MKDAHMIETTPISPIRSTIPDSHPPTPVTRSIMHKPVLKILGLGGGGSNAVNRMIELGIDGVEFIAANTDMQALQRSLATKKVQLGPKFTRGLGAGGDPNVGQAAAEESEQEIRAALQGADMVFLTAGMGGGTGTGSIPVAARISRELGAVTIAIVTTPFSFERGRRQSNARNGLFQLRPNTDTLITIPNERLLYIAPRDLPLELTFRLADDVLRQAAQGITELITEPGLINVDFAHVRHIMKLGGGALMSIGHGQGDDKALKAVEHALHHPLLETATLTNAAGILVNFTSGEDLSIFEVEAAVNHLKDQAGSNVEIVMGVTRDDRLMDRAQVILIATGLGAPTLEESLPGLVATNHASTTSTSHVHSNELIPAIPIRRSLTTEITEGTSSTYMQSSSPAPQPFEADPSFTISTDLDLPAFLRQAK
jgi:cell division protein FtsZ